jgi:hypothetical protein
MGAIWIREGVLGRNFDIKPKYSRPADCGREFGSMGIKI